MGSHQTTIYVLIALFAASVEPILVKLGYRGSVTPYQLLLFRYPIAALTVLVLTRIPRTELLLQDAGANVSAQSFRKKLGALLTVAPLLALTNFLTLFALKHLTVAVVVSVITTTPAFVALVNQWRGRHELGPRFWVGFALCFSGIILSVGLFSAGPLATTEGHVSGLLFLAMAVGSSTLYRTRLEDITKVMAPRIVSAWIFILNTVLVFALILPWVGPLPEGAIAIGAWSGMAAGLANLAFLWGIQKIGATRMSIFDLLQRPLVIVISAIFLGEALGVAQGVGAILVLAGVWLAKVKRPPPKVVPDQVVGEALHAT